MRRMAACLAPGAVLYLFATLPEETPWFYFYLYCLVSADGIVINMVVGGEVVTLKSIEEACNLIIAELPIQVSFMFFIRDLSLWQLTYYFLEHSIQPHLLRHFFDFATLCNNLMIKNFPPCNCKLLNYHFYPFPSIFL